MFRELFRAKFRAEVLAVFRPLFTAVFRIELRAVFIAKLRPL